MSGTRNKFLLRLRLIAVFLGLALLIWFAIEDKSELLAILLSILICSWLAIYFLVRKTELTKLPTINFITAGMLAGAGVTPVALFLMIFKIGLHGHAIPDFSIQDFLSVIYRTPFWLISGLLISSGTGIWLKRNHKFSEPNHAAEG